MKYMVSSQDQPQNFHIYSIHSDVDYFIMYNANQTQEKKIQTVLIQNQNKL